MILLIVQNFNIQLTERHSFLYLIRKYLCLAVTHNAVSPIISVFEKALAIFVQMVNKFKAHLKRPIEVKYRDFWRHCVSLFIKIILKIIMDFFIFRFFSKR